LIRVLLGHYLTGQGWSFALLVSPISLMRFSKQILGDCLTEREASKYTLKNLVGLLALSLKRRF
jgi:hypothetical protein